MAVVEPAQSPDVRHIRRIATLVFDHLGNYAQLLPKFFSSEGVTTYVARLGSDTVGFVMLGFLPWSGDSRTKDKDPWIADLLAIAVEPRRQRRKIGSALLDQAFALVAEMSEWRDVQQIQLTCAETNHAGLAFFQKHGFTVINPFHGEYSGGQKAIRLARDHP